MVGKRKEKKYAAPAALDGEEAFPRGGGSTLAPVAKRALEKEAYAEAEAELFGGKKGKKRRGATTAEEQEDEEDAFFASQSLHGKLPKYAELLKFKSLSVGTKLWGAVMEVSPHGLVVSLPHGLRGSVAYAEASDYLGELARKREKAAAAAGGGEGGAGSKRRLGAGGAEGPLLTELFTIGQLVRCCVVGLEGGGEDGGDDGGKKRKKVQLSLHVKHVNKELGSDFVKEGAALPACVRSVEDHGYTLTIGIKGTSGFLPRKAAPAQLREGALVETVVTKVRPGGVAEVTAAHDAVAGAAAREWEGLTIGSLVPGALVAARVRAQLSDGLLLSFLTFFSGTVDPFHLGVDPGADWRKMFSPNQRVKARVLYVDPASKRVGLSLARHLLAFSLPDNFPLLGQVFEDATVQRVDGDLGLLCELPAGPSGGALAPGYAHISSVADQKVESLEKRFRPGQRVRCRVTGFRPLDGLAVLSLKPSVVEQNVVSYADVCPGQPLSGTVTKVEDFGLLVAITPSVRAVVPTQHMSDLGTKKAHKKFKEGQKVSGRVLTVDPAARKLTLTLKPSLLGSKLPLITCLQDAVPGGRSHGVVTGTKDFGVFVTFYGGVAGLAHVSECGLAPGQKPAAAFEAGQVVKCRVLAHDPKHKGLKLSLVSKKAAKAAAATQAEQEQGEGAAEPAANGAAEPTAAAAQQQEGGDALGGLQAGDVVEAAVVTSVQTKEVEGGAAVPHHVEVEIALEGGRPVRGRLDAAHLADHPVAQQALWDALKPGAQLGPLLVLQRLEGGKSLRLSRKTSLVAAAAALPRTLADVQEGSALPGVVASVTGDSVFVRFLNGVTGRAGLAALSDTFVSDPHLHFEEGQSVRVQVVAVDRERERFSLTLKQSVCGGSDAGYLASLFRDLEAAAALGGEGDWAADFALGGAVSGSIHDVKDYGVLCDMDGHPDVVGLAAPHQVPDGGAVPGRSMGSVVLDVSKRDGIVDLSLQPHLLTLSAAAAEAAAGQQPAKKRKKLKAEKGGGPAGGAAEGPLQLGQQLEATVQLAKAEEGYCVVSLAAPRECDGAAAAAGPVFLGYLPTTDFNLARAPPVQQAHEAGDVLRCKVAALPSLANGGRLLLHAPLDVRAAARRAEALAGGKAGGKGAGAGNHPKFGELLEASVDAVHDVYAELTLPGYPGCRGRLHLCEAGAPLSELQKGGKLKVVVVGHIPPADAQQLGLAECSTRPAALEAAAAGTAASLPKPLGWAGLKAGQQLEGLVHEVVGDCVYCVFSPSVRGRAFLTQAAKGLELPGAKPLSERFSFAQPVKAHIVSVDAKKRRLELSLVGPAPPPTPGQLVLGRVLATGGAGVNVQIGGRAAGKVALTDLHDSWVDNALVGAPEPGSIIRVRIIGPVPGAPSQFMLSLRPRDLAEGGGGKGRAAKAAEADGAPPESLPAEDLQPGQRVGGYVKGAGKMGGFVCLARDCDARVRLGQLADKFVDDPAGEFPPGKRVAGKVLHVEGGRVEISLRTGRGGAGAELEGMEEGQVVRGRVKRVEAFGVFVKLESGATGLAHKSELADTFVKDIGALFSTGQRVAARVLKVDRSVGRLSLGLKPSYFEGLDPAQLRGEGSDEEEDFDAEVEAALAAEGADEEEAVALAALRTGADSEDEGSLGPSDDEDDAGEASDSEGDEEGAGGWSDGREDEGSDSEGEGGGPMAEEGEEGTPSDLDLDEALEEASEEEDEKEGLRASLEESDDDEDDEDE